MLLNLGMDIKIKTKIIQGVTPKDLRSLCIYICNDVQSGFVL